MIIIYVILSFILDGFMSNYINNSLTNYSYFNTIYSLISLVIIYNYFENDKKYLSFLLVTSVLFDIAYTNTFPVNTLIFLIIYFLIKKINYYVPNNYLTINIKTVLCITIYHILSYFILLFIDTYNYPLKVLWIIISRNIIMTIIYTTISYLIFKNYYFKTYKKKIK